VDLFAGFIGGIIPIFANAYGYFFWGKWMCQFEGFTVSTFSKKFRYKIFFFIFFFFVH